MEGKEKFDPIVEALANDDEKALEEAGGKFDRPGLSKKEVLGLHEIRQEIIEGKKKKAETERLGRENLKQPILENDEENEKEKEAEELANQSWPSQENIDRFKSLHERNLPDRKIDDEKESILRTVESLEVDFILPLTPRWWKKREEIKQLKSRAKRLRDGSLEMKKVGGVEERFVQNWSEGKIQEINSLAKKIKDLIFKKIHSEDSKEIAEYKKEIGVLKNRYNELYENWHEAYNKRF